MSDGPYRGFVELPRAVFEAAKSLGEIIVEEAVKRAGAAGSTHAYKRAYDVGAGVIDYVCRHVAPDGWTFEMSRANEMTLQTRAWFRHLCGAMGGVVFDERLLAVLPKSEVVHRIACHLDETLVCYCVPPDPTPHQSALREAIGRERMAGRRPARILAGPAWISLLVGEMAKDALPDVALDLMEKGLDGGSFLGIPIKQTFGVETFEIETEEA